MLDSVSDITLGFTDLPLRKKKLRTGRAAAEVDWMKRALAGFDRNSPLVVIRLSYGSIMASWRKPVPFITSQKTGRRSLFGVTYARRTSLQKMAMPFEKSKESYIQPYLYRLVY